MKATAYVTGNLPPSAAAELGSDLQALLDGTAKARPLFDGEVRTSTLSLLLRLTSSCGTLVSTRIIGIHTKLIFTCWYQHQRSDTCTTSFLPPFVFLICLSSLSCPCLQLGSACSLLAYGAT